MSEVSFREVQSGNVGHITCNLDVDVLKVRGKVPTNVISAFFRRGGKCLISCRYHGAVFFFRKKWIYVPWNG